MNNTRHVLTISLPSRMAKAVKDDAKKGGYASVSEYVRDLVREREREKLAREFAAMSKDFENNKKGWKLLRSLKDLR